MSLKNPAKCEVVVLEVNILLWKMGLGGSEDPRDVICNLMINKYARSLCWRLLEGDRGSGVKTARAVETRKWWRAKQKVSEEIRGLT